MPRRRRSIHDLPKAHDWESHDRTIREGKNSFTQTVWRCTKCGIILKWQSKKPDIYARFEPFQANSLAAVTFAKRISGMLCDEVVTWKVMEF